MKKLFATFLALVMVLSSLCLPAVAAEGDHTTATTWDDLETTTVDGDTYRLIYNEAEFKLMASDLTANYRLAKNITFAEETYAQTTTDNGNSSFFKDGVFKGILDGNGHTLDFTNATFKYERGGTVLFKAVNGGTIKNLTVKTGTITVSHIDGCQQSVLVFNTTGDATFENVHVTASFTQTRSKNAANLGAFVGKVAAAGNVIIKNCTANVTIANNVVARAGAFIGAVGVDNAVVTIQDSVASGTIQGLNTKDTVTTGGFVGQINKAATLNVTNCVNNATVDSYFAGGILGSATNGTVVITNCVNLGSITGSNRVGGIMGPKTETQKASLTFDGCVNVGTVTSTAYRAAGIAPHFAGTSDTVKFSNCINFGAVSSTPDAATLEANSNKMQIFAADAIYCWYNTADGNTNKVCMENCVNFGTRSGYQAVVNGQETTYVKTTTAAMYETAPTTATGNVDFTADGAGTTAVANSALLAMGEEGKAQMRYSNTLTDAGIRFKIDTNSALRTALTNAGYTYTLGSLMATKATATEAGALTKAALEGKLHSDVNTGAVVKDNQYAVAVNNIGADYYATEFQCAGYITLTKGNTTYTIYTEASEARSLAYVADAILDKNEETAAIEKYGATLAIFQAALPTE